MRTEALGTKSFEEEKLNLPNLPDGLWRVNVCARISIISSSELWPDKASFSGVPFAKVVACPGAAIASSLRPRRSP